MYQLGRQGFGGDRSHSPVGDAVIAHACPELRLGHLELVTQDVTPETLAVVSPVSRCLLYTSDAADE